jgi:hypothetical protein
MAGEVLSLPVHPAFSANDIEQSSRCSEARWANSVRACNSFARCRPPGDAVPPETARPHSDKRIADRRSKRPRFGSTSE